MNDKRQKSKETKKPASTPPPGKNDDKNSRNGPEAREPSEGPASAGGDSGGEESGWAAGAREALEAENAELKDKLLRTAAEMENLRRRTERDKADMAKYAISNFARDVLTVADHIALAIGHVPEEAAEKDPALKSFRDGILVTERELLNVMERHGITRLDPKGERFDPNRHQAMYEVENPDVPEGTILEVVQAGYEIADRVLRPAMVGVAKGGAKPARSDAPPQAANDDNPDGTEPPGDGGIGGTVDKSA